MKNNLNPKGACLSPKQRTLKQFAVLVRQYEKLISEFEASPPEIQKRLEELKCISALRPGQLESQSLSTRFERGKNRDHSIEGSSRLCSSGTQHSVPFLRTLPHIRNGILRRVSGPHSRKSTSPGSEAELGRLKGGCIFFKIYCRIQSLQLASVGKRRRASVPTAAFEAITPFPLVPPLPQASAGTTPFRHRDVRQPMSQASRQTARTVTVLQPCTGRPILRKRLRP
jgi:hypothetical protein